ncbi:MAG: hypothetical protein IH588_18540 [Anaerolineales bacterium]|nr:hypothetical protein [Anaerolineales bacterium]
MKDQVITFTFEGLDANDSDVRLSDFVYELQQFISASKKADEIVSKGATATFYYKIIDLHHSSPASLTAKTIPTIPESDAGESAHDYLFAVMDSIEKKQIKDRIEYSLLKTIKSMTDPIGKTLSSVIVRRDENVIYINTSFKEKVNVIFGPEETYPGHFRGMLDAINVHNRANVFWLYPEVGPKKITCHFPSDIKERAIQAVGKRVEIRGIFKYKTNAQYPHEADVKTMDVFEPNEEYPSFMDIYGLDPGMTGGLSSEDFIRKIRNEQ